MENRQPTGFPIMISETNPKREEIMVRGRQSTNVRKRQIMAAARKLIMRFGSEHVTVRNMAKEVGCLIPSYFPYLIPG